MPERTEKLREYQTLYEAWSAFSLYKYNYQLQKQRQRIFLIGIIPFCLVVSTAVLLAPLLKAEGTYQVLSGGLKGVIFLLPISFAILVAAVWRGIRSQKWISLLSAAEAIRSVIYRYRVSAGTRNPEESKSRNANLEQHVVRIRRQLAAKNIDLNGLNSYHGRIPQVEELAARGDDGFCPLTSELYAEFRLRAQIKAKREEISSARSALRRLSLGIVSTGVLGSVLAALAIDPWMIFTLLLISAFSLQQEYIRLERAVSSQSNSMADLLTIEHWWNTLMLTQKTQPRMVDALVKSTEAILTAESMAWIPLVPVTNAEQTQKPEEDLSVGADSTPAELPDQGEPLYSPNTSVPHQIADGAFYGPVDVPDADTPEIFNEAPNRDDRAHLETDVIFPFESYLSDGHELEVDDFIPGIPD